MDGTGDIRFHWQGYILVWEWGDTDQGLEFRDTGFGDRGFGEY